MAEPGDTTESAGTPLLRNLRKKEEQKQANQVFDEALDYNRQKRPANRVAAEEAAQQARIDRSRQPS